MVRRRELAMKGEWEVTDEVNKLKRFPHKKRPKYIVGENEEAVHEFLKKIRKQKQDQ